jgi:uncharacterized protein YcbX
MSALSVLTPRAIGEVEALFRYPVKSMRGEALETAVLGWHGIEGDRRFALRRVDERSGFPWLSASRLPDLLQFSPTGRDDATGLPTHVRTPEGEELPLSGDDLAAEVQRRCGERVEILHLKHGTFDEATVSVITSDTVREVCRLAGRAPDARRFRPNVLIRSSGPVPFEEDDWVGGVLTFGDDGPAVSVTMRDVRCVMLNFDPDDGARAPEMMKAVVRANENHAGVYGSVTRIGRLAVGQTVRLHR